MTIKWSFSYNSFLKLFLITWFAYNMTPNMALLKICTVFMVNKVHSNRIVDRYN